MMLSNFEKDECNYSCGCKLFHDREKKSDLDFKLKLDCETFKMQQTTFWQTFIHYYSNQINYQETLCFRILKIK